MTKRQAQRFVETYVLPGLPGYRADGDVVVRDDGHLIARGLVLNRSQLDQQRFELRSWGQPLFDGSDDIILTFARSLGSFELPADEAGRRALGEEIVRRAKAEEGGRLAVFSDYGRFARQLESLAPYGLSPVYALAVRAGAEVLDGRPADARRDLEAALDEADRRPKAPPIADRARVLLADLDAGGDRAVNRLRGWAGEAAEALGLPLRIPQTPNGAQDVTP